jgi:hypothetical protein
MIQSTRNGFDIAEEEINRLEASPVQGDQSCMVQRDMKQWAQKEGMWPMSQYTHIVDAHARHRGWTQEGVTGMEIADETI